MKTVSIALSLVSGLLMAAGHGRQVRVSIQYVELPHADLTVLLAGSPGNESVHGKAMELVRANKARILETCIGVCQSGGKATFESIREEIYPTETQPPGLPGTFSGPVSRSSQEPHYSTRQRAFTAFETRNSGTMLDLDAEVMKDGRYVHLRLAPEIGSRNRLETMVEYRDKRGDASVRMPIYETWRTNTSITVRSGKFALVSVIHPKRPQPAPFVDSRILLFVRADVLETP
jgi:hypothetical protein